MKNKNRAKKVKQPENMNRNWKRSVLTSIEHTLNNTNTKSRKHNWPYHSFNIQNAHILLHIIIMLFTIIWAKNLGALARMRHTFFSLGSGYTSHTTYSSLRSTCERRINIRKFYAYELVWDEGACAVSEWRHAWLYGIRKWHYSISISLAETPRAVLI